MERRGQQEIVPGGETDAAREAKADETRNKGNKVETKDFLKSRMRENRTYGSVRGCKTEPLTQTKTWVKERRSRESLLDKVFFMQLDTKMIVSVSEANKNFSRVARTADNNGRAVIFKNNKPKYLMIDLEQESLIYDLTDDEKLEIASKRILKQYKPAFEELAK